MVQQRDGGSCKRDELPEHGPGSKGLTFEAIGFRGGAAAACSFPPSQHKNRKDRKRDSLPTLLLPKTSEGSEDPLNSVA